ncbi:MAG: sodium:calcium antiporter, partial [Calditrichales bacterium]
MDIVLQFVLLTAGILLLLKGADYFVKSASAFADQLAVPKIVIGLTIVAFGTSTPELIVNIFASIEAKDAITIGNV